MTIGENIQKRRKELGWSQEDLAKKLGVSISTVGMIETDKRNVKDKIKFQLCSLFNISIAELMGTNDVNWGKLKHNIISVFLQHKTDEVRFTEIKQELVTMLENETYLKLREVRTSITTKEILQVILQFSKDFYPRIDSIIDMNIIEKEANFIQEHKETITEIITSLVYEDLKFNSYLNVFSQYSNKTESSILKNPFEEQDRYIAIQIETDRMIPKYEKGNIVIIQKAEIFTNGQDVCFKNKFGFEIGRVYIKDNIVAIQYFNTNYNTQFFEFEEFKRIYIGIVVSTRLYN